VAEIPNRAKELLPSALLTLMSIIQALALEFLWGVARSAPKEWSADAALVWLQIVTNLLGILQVWMFYTSVALRFRWVPATRDLLLPFLIGILEFTLVDLTGGDHLALWFFTLATVYTVATWDAHNVFARARLDADNAEYFTTIAPAQRRDFMHSALIVTGLLLLGAAILVFGAALPLAFAGLLFAAAALVYQLELGRRFWNRTMSLG
jgi:hypothetical protein